MKIRHLGLTPPRFSIGVHPPDQEPEVLVMSPLEYVHMLWRVRAWRVEGEAYDGGELVPFSGDIQSVDEGSFGDERDILNQVAFAGFDPAGETVITFAPQATRQDAGKPFLVNAVCTFGVSSSNLQQTNLAYVDAASDLDGASGPPLFRIRFSVPEFGYCDLIPRYYWTYADPDGSAPVYGIDGAQVS